MYLYDKMSDNDISDNHFRRGIVYVCNVNLRYMEYNKGCMYIITFQVIWRLFKIRKCRRRIFPCRHRWLLCWCPLCSGLYCCCCLFLSGIAG